MDDRKKALAEVHTDGATSLDEDEVEGLRLPNISTRRELDHAEHQNVLIGSVWIEKRSTNLPLDEALVWELHRRMFDQVWSWAGKVRKTLKSPGVLVENIRPELRNLLEDVAAQEEVPGIDRKRLCAEFHQRLVRIHVFPNGNGRHARLITDFLARRLQIDRPNWGNARLTSTSETHSPYIAALRRADGGHFDDLVKFMWTSEKKAD